MEKEQSYRTHQIVIKKGHRLYAYFSEMTENAKNLYNTTNFYIRQAYTGLRNESPLHPLQKEVLSTIRHELPLMNDVQRVAYEKRLTRELMKPEEKRKPVVCNEFKAPSTEKPYVSYGFLDALFKRMKQEDYRSLPTQSAQAVMKNVFQNWASFYASLKDYKSHPHKYKGRPRIPKYSRSTQKEIVFSNQDCVIKESRFLKFPKTKTRLNIGKLGMKADKLKQVRVLPRNSGFVVELVMQSTKQDVSFEHNGRYMGIDLGVDNLMAIVTNTGANPLLIKGTPIKSINHYYNQQKAHYTSVLRQGKTPKQGMFTSQRLTRLYQTRQRRIKDYFHKASKAIVTFALQENVRMIVIGYNPQWKQDVELGTKNNRSFSFIPHGMIVNMITYKAQEHGITVVKQEESYTSMASFLDHDIMPVYGEKKDEKPTFSGRRIQRGLYRTKNGVLLNADVNGAGNILRKAVPTVHTNGIQGLDGSQSINVSTPRSLLIS